MSIKITPKDSKQAISTIHNVFISGNPKSVLNDFKADLISLG